MAFTNTLNITTLNDGPEVFTIKADIESGNLGQINKRTLIDVSLFSPTFTDSTILAIQYTFEGFSAKLLWEATTNVVAFVCTQGIFSCVDRGDYRFASMNQGAFSAIPNNAGAGKTGNMLITTNGLDGGDFGTLILTMKKS